jgi:nicotinamidase/pyrazinamidase
MGVRAPDAFLIVDVQNDFCAGGALAVPDGDAVVPVINRVARAMADRGAPIFASRDWHPRESRHFAAHGGPWPVHCVAGTPGAQFHPGLELPDGTRVVTKGDTVFDHGYSAFDGHLDDGRALARVLSDAGVTRLVVGGLATDYCVLHSVLDARRAGFDVLLLEDAVRGVNVAADDSRRAVERMERDGVEVGASADVLDDAAPDAAATMKP